MSWIALIAALVVLLAIDLLVVRGRGGEMSLRAAGVASATWVGVALAFCAVLLLAGERADAEAFLAGYLVEKSLSLDNVFVFLLVFTAFGLPDAERHRLLSYGIVLALVLRRVFIVVGAAALSALRVAGLRLRRVPDLDGLEDVRHRHDHGAEEAMVERDPREAARRLGRCRTGAAALAASRSSTSCSRSTRCPRSSPSRTTPSSSSPPTRSRCSACGRCSSSWPTWSSASTTSRPRSPALLVFIGAKMAAAEFVGKIGPEIAARDRRDPRHRRRGLAHPQSPRDTAGMRFPGVIPAVTTPFDASGAVDLDALAGQRPLAARRRPDRPRRQRHDGRGPEPQPRRAPAR